MYWRINCTEHLLLDVRLDPTSNNSTNANTQHYRYQQPSPSPSPSPQQQQQQLNEPRRIGRQRSITYSSGVGPRPGRTAANNTHLQTLGRSMPDPTLIVRWASSPDGRLLAGITRQGIYLWLLKPFAMLSCLVYDSVEEFGSMVDIVWEDPHNTSGRGEGTEDDSRVATFFVVLSMGYIFEILVYKRDTPVLEYQFATQHYFARGPGEGRGIPPLGIAQKRTYRLPGNTAVVCAAAAATPNSLELARADGCSMALIATRTHVHRLTWMGALASSSLIKDIYGDPLAHVRQMLCISEDGLVGSRVEIYLFSDGAIRIVQKQQRGAENADSSGEERAVVRALDAPGVAGKFTVVAYSPISRMLAAGATSGDVLLYSVGADGGLERVERIKFEHDKSAQVSSIAWTADGAAVACGYTTGHVSIYTVLGYELNTTRLSGQPASDYFLQPPIPVFLSWAPGAARLFVFSDCLSTTDHAVCAQQADCLPFVRAALSTVPCEGNSKRVCLFSDEKVFLHHCEFGAQDLADQQPEMLWHVAHIPAEYTGMNWPIRYVAADDDGQHIAVAGAHGLACYGVRAHKWRMLRNQQQEESITCVGGLLWYRNYLVAACINHGCGDAPQLLFFPRSRELDTTSDLQTVALESPAVTMSCHNSILLVLCANKVVYQYAIFDDTDFIQVSFRRAIDLGPARVDPRRVRSLQWVPSAHFDQRAAFLVHEGTALAVVEEAVGQHAGGLQVTAVSSRAEFTITSAVNFGKMHSTVWWFSGAQLHACLVSLEDFMDGATARLSAQMMCIRPEFFPVAVSADKGMAVGLDQDWIVEEGTVVGLARLPVRAKLYLHSTLDRMLADGMEQDALLYAACFEHLEFFAHAMEILLHEALVRTMSEDVVLSRVVALLENFAGFHEIVVHCARKTEAAFWPRLFASVGGPARFFGECLRANKLATATQCLLVLQTLEPASVNAHNILVLLGKAAGCRNRTVCLEILRFLRMASGSDDAMKRLLDKLHQNTT
ncbi:WD40 repeat protein [Coemansia spiralis]|uniref:WD40 repeat protein n=1 Tax=Coemansia spiralis TaxID=417178 RepID=A0A9W8KYG1_9FUNG|nr:WD40 repeat protein [Coemansia spiralis]